MELVDLCPLETWAALEDEIYERSGLNPAVYDIAGVRINPRPRWPNRLCPEIKANPKGQSFICATAHMNMANQARQSGRSHIGRRHLPRFRRWMWFTARG
jgi:ligand-binding sensor protein